MSISLMGYVVLKTEDEFCEDVVTTITVFKDSYWFEKFEVDYLEYNILALHVMDNDDFGGTFFYAVPVEDTLKYANQLKEWIEQVSKTPISIDQFYDDDFYPSFDGIIKYNNW